MRRVVVLTSVVVLLLSAAPGCDFLFGGGGGGPPPCKAPPPPPLGVSASVPYNGALDQPTNTGIALTFTYAMDIASVQANLEVLDGVTPIAGTITSGNANKTFTFTPTAWLTVATTYTVRLPAGTLSVDKGPMARDYAGTLTTHNGFHVEASSPWDLVNGVPTNARVSVLFNMPVDAATLSNSTFIVAETSGGPDIGGTITLTKDGRGATYEPGPLKQSSQYYWRVTAGSLKSVDGTGLDPLPQQTFWTGSGTDTVSPRSFNWTPAIYEWAISQGTDILFETSEPIDPVTVNEQTFDLSTGSRWLFDRCEARVSVFGRWTFENQNTRVRFTPGVLLPQNRHHFYFISADVTDVSGNGLLRGFGTNFHTGGPPTVVNPCGTYTTDVGRNISVPLDVTTLTPANITISPPVAFTVFLTPAYWPSEVVITPKAPLSPGTYSVTYGANIRSSTGIQIDGNNDGVVGDPYVLVVEVTP